MSGSKKAWQWYWMPTAVFLIALSSIVLLLWAGRMSEKQRINTLIIDAVMDVQINASTGHLWLEEAVTGDDTADEALADMEQAINLITVALNGGKSEHGMIPEPLDDLELRVPAEELRSLLVNFKLLGRERLQNPRKGGVASDLDQQFDAVFKEILGKAGILEDLIEKKNAESRAKSWRLFLGILSGWSVVVFVTTFGLWSHDRRRRSAEEALRKANEQLLSQTEELTGHREHLAELVEKRTDELTTANERLRSEFAERQRANEFLRQRQRAIEASSNGIVITDMTLPDNPIIYVNPAFEQITGYRTEDVLGSNLRLLTRDDRQQTALEEIRSALRERREARAVLRSYRKDGSLFWNELSMAPVQDENGTVTHFIGILNDITERKQYEKQLERQANYDGLTGLPNRNLLSDRLRQALTLSRRAKREAAVMFLDLDQFNLVNEGLGHSIGDRILQLVSERLVECVRSSDTVARYSGDEFVIVLSGVEKSDYAADLAQRLHEAVARPLKTDGHEIVLSCSIGISLYPRDGEDEEILLRNADLAMYRAKEQGRGTFQFYTGEMNERIVTRMTMEKHLRRALENNELVLHYQPQVELKTGRITGAEALLRWRNPDLGLVSPARFIPLAEETGLIVPIGEWALRVACEQHRAWQDAGFRQLTMAVNLSARQFWHRDLIDTVSRIVADTGLDPGRLELELTESMIMRDVENAAAAMSGLKDLGVQLSMDDFGTGYSSLSQLKRFSFDKLKIDISFVREITRDPGSAAIARTIIAMAHNLNLLVIAEGVETEGQLAYLRDHGCDEMQGYFFSKPLPAEEFDSLLRMGTRLQLDASPAWNSVKQ